MTFAPTATPPSGERVIPSRESAAPLARAEPVRLGPMPGSSTMVTNDAGFARVPVLSMFEIVRDVEAWPTHLSHYRSVHMLERDSEGGGVVTMRADRPFGALRWPTSWTSLMEVDAARRAVRFRHIGGLTTGMEVEWSFAAAPGSTDGAHGTRIRLVHNWRGWALPLVGPALATSLIGPVFVHGIAERTIAGLVGAAEKRA